MLKTSKIENTKFPIPMRYRYSSDYYPFGSTLPTRSWSDASRTYRYGFNGKEKDFETANDDYDFGARIYDGRLGRWMSVDPLMKKYAEYSVFGFSINCPITLADINGKDFVLKTSFVNSSFLLTYLGLIDNHIILLLISSIKEELYLTAYDPLEDFPNKRARKIIVTHYAYYNPDKCNINFNFWNEIALQQPPVFLVTMVHELIHKKLEIKYLNIIDENGNITCNYSEEYESIVSTIEKYGKNSNKWQHEWIALCGRKDIISALRFEDMNQLGQLKDRSGTTTISDSDGNNKTYSWTSNQWYEAMSWSGLTDTDQWNKLSIEDQDLYSTILNLNRPSDENSGIKTYRPIIHTEKKNE
jgi:RHS repeat-associated protein